VTASFSQLPQLKVTLDGSGQVVSSPSGINCTAECTANFPSGTAVSLTATPASGWKFVSWTGPCLNATQNPCHATIGSAGANITAVLTLDVRSANIGFVFSSAQPSSQSYFRFINSGTTAGFVSVSFYNFITGEKIGVWTSKQIPAGRAPQIGVAEMESALVQIAKPSFYSAIIEPTMNGAVQHVLYHPLDGTLTNLSTCSVGTTAIPTQVANVHSSILGNGGFPSTIVVINNSSLPAPVTLGIYDSVTGNKLSQYALSAIAANAQAVISMSTIEAAVGLSPVQSNILHYTIKIENPTSFTGFLQHLVFNQKAGVVTDMTTVCSFTASYALADVNSLLQGAVYSTSQNESQSYLRFLNTGSSTGTITFTLYNSTTGALLATWTSPSLAPNVARQFSIDTIEGAASVPFTKPAYYSLSVRAQISGNFQHVLYHPLDGTLTNLTTCSAVTANPSELGNVHSSLLGSAGFPSSVVVINTGSAAAVTLGIYDAVTGVKLGNFTSANIMANAQAIIPVSAIEAAAHISIGSIQHYVVKVENTDVFTGYLQHVVDNQKAGVVTDMSTSCKLASSP
jgi:hypothetical protein